MDEMINELKRVGAQIDKEGNVIVYHRTSIENAELIRKSGIMLAKEDGLFFSTKRNGYNIGYGNGVITLKIPVSMLVTDDFFGDEYHLRLPLGNKRRLDISQYLV